MIILKKAKTQEEIIAEKIKMEIATELGLDEKILKYGWSSLTAKESGKIGGIISRRKKGIP